MNVHASKPNGDLIRLVVIDRDHDTLVKTSQALMATQQVDIASESTTYSIACSIIDRHQPGFAVIGVDDERLYLIEKIRTRCPSVKIICVGDSGNTDLILRCFRSGADEFLQRPLFAEELAPVFERLRSRLRAEIGEAAQSNGRVLAFLGSSGGCGTSTVAFNSAHHLAQQSETILVDFHFGQGDLSVHGNAQPAFSLRDLSETDEPIDQALIDSVTQQNEAGLRMIFQPYDCQPYTFHYEHIQTLLHHLKQSYAYIVLDMGTDMERCLDCLDLIDEWFLVFKQELPSLFLAARRLQSFMLANVEPHAVQLVVNAYGKNKIVSLPRMAKTLYRQDLHTVRHDEKTVLSAQNQGLPLQKASRWSRAAADIQTLTQRWLKQESAQHAAVQPSVSDQRLKRQTLPPLLHTGYTNKAAW